MLPQECEDSVRQILAGPLPFWWFSGGFLVVSGCLLGSVAMVLGGLAVSGPPNPDQEPRADLELRLRQARLCATSDHVHGPGPHPLDVLQQVHRLRQQRIARERLVRQAQLVHGQGRRQPARIHDLKPVREQHHLNAAVVRIVPVGHRVHDRLGHHLLWDLVLDRRLHALRSGAHRQRDLAQDEVHRLVHERKHRALVDLVGGNRLGHLRPVEVRALDLGGDEKALRGLSEEQHCGVGQPALVQQVQMPEQIFRRRLRR